MSLRKKESKYKKWSGKTRVFQSENIADIATKNPIVEFRYQLAALWTLVVSTLLGVAIVFVTQSNIAVAENKPAPQSSQVKTKVSQLVEPLIAVKIRNALPKTKIEWIRYTAISGLYEFKAGRSILYTDRAGQYLLVGHVWDLKNNQDLTQVSKDKYLPVLNKSKQKTVRTRIIKNIPWRSLPLAAAVRYGNPKGKKIAIFHDPDCPYCHRMKKEMVKSNKFDVYQIMYPIQSLHPKAFAKSQAILCQSKNITSNKCDMRKELQSSIAFAQKHNIRGTPTVVAANGSVFVGYRPAQQLLTLLNNQKLVAAKTP